MFMLFQNVNKLFNYTQCFIFWVLDYFLNNFLAENRTYTRIYRLTIEIYHFMMVDVMQHFKAHIVK